MVTLKPEAVQRILRSDWTLLRGAFSTDQKTGSLSEFLGEVSPLERKMFDQVGPLQMTICNVVLMRLQFRVFRAFLPMIREEPDVYTPVFVPILSDILRRVEVLERKMEEFNREAASENNEELRRELNASSSALHQTKMEFCSSVVSEGILTLGPHPDETLLKTVQQQVAHLQTVGKSAKAGAYAVPIRQRKKKERHLFTQIVLWSMIFFVVAWPVWTFLLLPYIHQKEIGLPVRISIEEVDDDSVVIHMAEQDWQNLTPALKQESIARLTVYSKGKHLRQLKIVDKSGKMIGAILGSADKKNKNYIWREF